MSWRQTIFINLFCWLIICVIFNDFFYNFSLFSSVVLLSRWKKLHTWEKLFFHIVKLHFLIVIIFLCIFFFYIFQSKVIKLHFSAFDKFHWIIIESCLYWWDYAIWIFYWYKLNELSLNALECVVSTTRCDTTQKKPNY